MIFLDLDGSLLDVAPRYHRLHSDFVSRLGGRPLEPAEYWEAKREGTREPALLARTGLSPEAAARADAARLRWIEGRRYLRLDRPWSWTLPVLQDLVRRAPLVLVTLRRRPDRLRRQLGILGLLPFFERVVAAPGDGTPEAKARLVREAGFTDLSGSVFVGDTEVDVASGRALGLRTAALSAGGLRTAARLAAWSPDALLEDLRQVPAWLDSLS